MGEIAKPHVSLFTLLIQRPESARALLCERLPRRIVDRLGPEPFAAAAGKSANVDLRAARIDGLFRMPVIGSDVPIYCVVEHRSTVDPEVLLRLLDYQSRVLTLVASERTKELSHFPQVKVLVVYNGRQRWTLPLSFKEWVALPELNQDGLDFGYALAELGEIADEALSAEPGLRAGLMALKYARRPERQPAVLVEMIKACRAVPALEEPLLNYLRDTWEAIDPESFDRVIEQQAQEMEGPMTTINQQLLDRGREQGRDQGRDEGRDQGRAEGKADMLVRLIQARFGTVGESCRTRISTAGEDELDRWSIRLLRAADLDSVFN